MARLRVAQPTLAQMTSNDGWAKTALGLIIAALVIGFLFVGKEVFEPLVIAALLSFILAPPIRALRIWGLGKIPSALVVVIIAGRNNRGWGFGWTSLRYGPPSHATR